MKCIKEIHSSCGRNLDNAVLGLEKGSVKKPENPAPG